MDSMSGNNTSRLRQSRCNKEMKKSKNLALLEMPFRSNISVTCTARKFIFLGCLLDRLLYLIV